MSDVFHVYDSIVVYEDRPDGSAETYSTYSERTFGVEARHNEWNDEQPQEHEAVRLSASDTASVESERTWFIWSR